MSANTVICRPLQTAQLLEPPVDDRILRPVAMVEVPPLDLVDREALGLHRPPQQLAMPALE